MAKKVKQNRRTLNAVMEAVLMRESARAERTNYSIQEQIVIRGERLSIPRQDMKVERPTIVVFADDAPLYNWAHPCRYLLHDAESGELYRDISARFPPAARTQNNATGFRPFHQPVQFPSRVIFPLPPITIWRPRSGGRRYAVLFSGMSNNRHANDLEYLFRTLIDVYGYARSDITVLNYDGTLNYDGGPQPVTNWPGDGTPYRMTVDGKGSKSELLGALDKLKKRLRPDDSLLIHTNNHGGHNGSESDLCCFPNWDSLGVKEFTKKLSELPKFGCLVVMMEQCHSGGFNAGVIANSPAVRTSIASACLELNSSIGGADFDPFARDWIAAVTGADPYGHALVHDPDTNHDGRISAREAFNYADSIHDPFDTPVYHQAGGGDSCALGRELIRWLPPLLVLGPIIRKHWPDPGPIFEKRLQAILPKIEMLEEQFERDANKLQEDYSKQIVDIIKGVDKS